MKFLTHKLKTISIDRNSLRQEIRLCIEKLESRELMAIDFDFTYAGSVSGAPADVGFNDSNLTLRNARRDAFEATARALGSWFDHDATLKITVLDDLNAGDLYLASAGSPVRPSSQRADGFGNDNVAVTKVKTNGATDLNNSAADGTVTVNWSNNFELGNQTADFNFGEEDFVATVAHELLHVLGFASNINNNGTSFIDRAVGSKKWDSFDRFVTDKNQNVMINAGTFLLDLTRWNANKLNGETSPNGGIFFSGPNAMAANGGQPVPIYSPDPFEPGSSYLHVNDNDPSISFNTHLMVAAGVRSVRNARVLHPVEFGMMKDIGLNVIQPSVSFASTSSTELAEGIGSYSVSVALSVKPIEVIVLDIASTDTSEGTVNTNQLIFTPENWDQPQVVTVTSVDDFDVDGDVSFSLTITPNDGLSDGTFNLVAPTSIGLVSKDDDVPNQLRVTTLNDEDDGNRTAGDLSLREALLIANTQVRDINTIVFEEGLFGSGNQFITLNGSALPTPNPLNQSLKIQGPGARFLTISGNDQSRIFGFPAGSTPINFTLEDMTLASGNAQGGNGGAIQAYSVTINLTRVELKSNKAEFGGAIVTVGGVVRIDGSSFINNTGSDDGGGLAGYDSDIRIVNSTFSGNNAGRNGGGIFSTGGSTRIYHSTIIKNTANADEDLNDVDRGGGISSSVVEMKGSIVMGNRLDNSFSDIEGSLLSGSTHNLIGNTNTSGGLIDGVNNNIVGGEASSIQNVVSPILKQTDFGVSFYALVPGSLAIDASFPFLIDGSSATTDQRLFNRTLDGNADGMSQVDIGSFEAIPAAINGVPTNISYTENATPTLIAPSVSFFDVDDSDFANGSVRVFNVNAANSDRVGIRALGNAPGQINLNESEIRIGETVIGTFSGGIGQGPDFTIQFNGDASSANVRTVLRNLIFSAAGDTPLAGNTILQVFLTDGSGGIAKANDISATVTSVNDAPIVNGPTATQAVASNSVLTFNTTNANLVSVTDVDAGNGTIQLQLAATNGTLQLSGTTGITFQAGTNGSSGFTIRGTRTAINVSLVGLRFSPSLANPGSGSITLTANDLGRTGSGGAKTATRTINVAIGRPEFIVDNSSANYAETAGTWTTSSLTGFNGSSTRVSSSANATVTWQPNLAAGFYTIGIFKPRTSGSSNDAVVTIVHDGLTENQTVDLRSTTAGFVELPGVFYFKAGTSGLVRLTQGPLGGNLRADAIRFTRAEAPVVTIDNGTAGYAENSGAWANSGLRGIENSTTRFSASSNASATWTPQLSAGFYRVSIFRTATNSSSPAANVSVLANGVTYEHSVDLRTGVSGFLTLPGKFFFTGTGNEFVRLMQGTTLGTLRADAIRFEKVSAPAAISFIDNGQAGYSEAGVWSNSGMFGSNGSNTRFSAAANASAVWRLPSAFSAGNYRIEFFKVASSTSSSNAKITIAHSGTSTIKSIDLSTGTSGFVDLGIFAFNGNPGEFLRLSQGAVVGTLRADAVRFTLID
jgi:hypothetical protein